jgi:acyl-coenzyme A synthetase/AMP-(fatty) acid ligase
MFLNLHKKEKSALAAIDDSGTQISYGELRDFIKLFYNLINKRTLIFILSENSIGSLAGYVAALSNKVVPLVLSSKTNKDLLDNLIGFYKPEYLWLPERMFSDFPFDVVFKQYDFVLVNTGYNSFPLHDQLSLLIPTSGSTGSPKLVRHSYTNVEESARNVAAIFGLKTTDRAIAILPLHYTMGLSVVTSHLYAGATVLLVKANLMEKRFWNFIKEQRATSFTGVPYSFEVLYRLGIFKMDLPDLELLSQGGGKLNAALFEEYAVFAEKTGRRFIATYGQTEGTARMAYLRPELARKKICSIGNAIPNGRLWLVDDNGNEIKSTVAVGEMVYSGPNVTMGYAICGEDLAKGDENHGVLYTGDIARRDEDGCYYIIGRMNRFLKLYGIRVSLDECEQLIKSKFSIDCMCFGTDEKMKIMIKAKDQSKVVHQYLMEKTGLFHQAIEVIEVDEIPKNEAGKIIYT